MRSTFIRRCRARGVVADTTAEGGPGRRDGSEGYGGLGLDAKLGPTNRGVGAERHSGNAGAGDEPATPGPLVRVKGAPPGSANALVGELDICPPPGDADAAVDTEDGGTDGLVDAVCAYLDANPP